MLMISPFKEEYTVGRCRSRHTVTLWCNAQQHTDPLNYIVYGKLFAFLIFSKKHFHLFMAYRTERLDISRFVFFVLCLVEFILNNS